jgi:hypothetical protein
MLSFSRLNWGKRIRGLLGHRTDHPPVFFPHCRAVHTFGMREALDLFWVDRQFRVLRIERSVPGRKIKFCVEAFGVVEAFSSQKKSWSVGQKINLKSKASLFANENSGSVLVETAFVLPVLILLIFGFLQLSLGIAEKQKLTHALHYALLVGSNTNDDAKIAGAFDFYYPEGNVAYEIQNTDALSDTPISSANRRYNDVLSLRVQRNFPLQIPFFPTDLVVLESRGAIRITCYHDTPPYTCD